jgi:RNAse (barnase) inhibitor barstar
MVVKIDTRRITDWDSFHDLFAETFGFPDFYGRNMNAWNDCMGSLADPDSPMTKVHVPPGEVVVLHLEHVTDFATRCPEQYNAIVECAAWVNANCVTFGMPVMLALSYFKNSQPNT